VLQAVSELWCYSICEWAFGYYRLCEWALSRYKLCERGFGVTAMWMGLWSYIALTFVPYVWVSQIRYAETSGCKRVFELEGCA
jgi:hypothetical protein